MQHQVFQVGLYLALIVGFILVCGFVLKKLNARTLQAAGAIEIKATMTLGIKEKLVVVEYQGRQILLGVTPGCIAKLETFEQNFGPAKDAEQDNTSGAFKVTLQAEITRGKILANAD